MGRGREREGGSNGRCMAGSWYSWSSLPGFWLGTPRKMMSDTPLPPGSVFQLTHDVYKPFIFAADTLSDLSM